MVRAVPIPLNFRTLPLELTWASHDFRPLFLRPQGRHRATFFEKCVQSLTGD
jgi:hypothetical protein